MTLDSSDSRRSGHRHRLDATESPSRRSVGANGVRRYLGGDVTPRTAMDVGRAVASEGVDRVVVGADDRLSSDGRLLVEALCAGLRECGADVVTLESALTPVVARAVDWYDAGAAVAVTAPAGTASGNELLLRGPLGSAYGIGRVADVVERVRSQDFAFVTADGFGDLTREVDARRRYLDSLVEAGPALDGLEVVVSPGTGCGQLTARALSRLGAAVETMAAGPEDASARSDGVLTRNCRSLCIFVGNSAADFGVVHDPNGRRMLAVTDDGRFVPGDSLFALFAREAVAPGSRVAAPVTSGLAVRHAVESAGGSLALTACEPEDLVAAAAAPDVGFGGDPTGAWVWSEACLAPDGPLAAIRLAGLVARAGSVSSLAEDVGQSPVRCERIPTRRKYAVVDATATLFESRFADVTDLDAVRADTDDGLVLVRASETTDEVRVTAQAFDADDADALLETAVECVTEATSSLDARAEPGRRDG